MKRSQMSQNAESYGERQLTKIGVNYSTSPDAQSRGERHVTKIVEKIAVNR